MRHSFLLAGIVTPETVPGGLKAVTNGPKVTTNDLKVVTNEPEAATNDPEVATNEPEAATNEPEVAANDPEVVTNGVKVVTTDLTENTDKARLSNKKVPVLLRVVCVVRGSLHSPFCPCVRGVLLFLERIGYTV
ncbi:MAG: hypothetical protein LBQ88_06490 [Treponema sp.]|jgi:hypothetical protein|nr:hypothetical protein [Treponema sp.]